MATARAEHRGTVSFEGQVRTAGVPLYAEAVSIRHISAHGARVVTARPLRVQSRVELIDSTGEFRVAAEVVYCQPLADHSCVVGLWFPHGVPANG